MKTETIMNIVKAIALLAIGFLVGYGSGVWQYGVASCLAITLLSPENAIK